MQEIKFGSPHDLAKTIYNEAPNLKDFELITCCGFYDDIEQVLNAVLKFEETSLLNVELKNEDYNGYTKEYLLTINNCFTINVEPAASKKKNIYLGYDAEILFINNDCSIAIVNKNSFDDAMVYCYDY